MSDLNANERIAALSPEKRELLLKKLMEKQKQKNNVSNVLPQIEIETDMAKKYLPFEFSEVQQVYWMGESGLFDMGNCSTNIYSEYEIAGLRGIARKVFVRRLEKALNRLIERHDILRVIVLPEGMQKILKEVSLYHIKCVDLRGKDSEQAEEELERVRNNMRSKKTETNQWPLFEFIVHFLDGKRTILHVQMNALLIDGTSRGMFINELFRLTNRPSASLPALQCSYRDYVITWSKFKNSEVYKKSREYWLKQLSKLPAGPIFTFPGKYKAETPLQHEILNIELMDKQAWANFTGYASKFGLSGSSALLGAYVDLIAFWSSPKRFSIGVINTYRPPIHPRIEDVLGNFNTMQIITADVLSGNFIDRTLKLQQQVLYNIEHPYFSGPEVLRELNRVNVRSSKATLPVFFNSVISHSSFPGNSTKTVKSNGKSKFSRVRARLGKAVIMAFQAAARYIGLSLDIHQKEVDIYPSLIQLIPTIIEDKNGAVICKWQGVKNLFPDGVLKEMAENYQKLLKRLAENEESWKENWGETISGLSRVTGYIERTKEKTLDLDEDLNTLILRQVFNNEERAAIITPKQSLSYRELYSSSDRIAKLLQKKGIANNTAVAVMMEKSCEQIAVILGILLAGGAYIPVDVDISNKELEYLLQINSSYTVITQSWIGERLHWPDDIQRIDLDKEDLTDLDEKPLELHHKPDASACIIYNADCIDRTKFMKINHKSIVNAVLDINERLGVKSGDKLLSLYPTVSEQWLYDIFGMLTVGGTIILPKEQHKVDTLQWLQLIQREQVTIWNSSPVMLEELVNFLETQHNNKLNSLRLILLSNDRVPQKLLKSLETIFDNPCIVHLWGSSEAPIWSMMRFLKKGEVDMESIKFNQFLSGQSIYILNDVLQQCPIGTQGNIYIGGRSLDSINYTSHESCEKDFVRHPLTGEDLLRTAYIGRYTSEGYIEVVGEERDFEISIGGYFIFPHLVESELELHPEIRMAVVRIEEINDKRRLAAYIVTKENSSIEIEEVREFLKEKLPYYMIPTELETLDSIPLNLNGRINHSALAISSFDHREEKHCLTPRSDLEADLIKIWREVLGIEKISVKDNFFDLGGDSLKVLKIFYLIDKKFNKKITSADFFAEPTIEKLTSALF